MEIQELRKIYDGKKSIYKQLETEAKYILEDAFEEIELKYDRIESRIKKFNSFEKKIERKNIEDLEKINKVTDLLGLRVVCLFLSDLDKVKKIIKEEFKVVNEDDKLASEEVDKFGYRSIHYIVKVKDDCEGRRYRQIKNHEFEIQVRTLAMHSWANISHHLSYKSEGAIPNELQKDFHALSALFYLADKNFESLYKDSLKNIQTLLQPKNKSKLIEMPLNQDTLKAYFMSEMKDRKHNKNENEISKLIEEFKKVGITTIKAIDTGLEISKEVFLNYQQNSKIFTDIAIIRISFYILLIEYCEILDMSMESKLRYDSLRKKIPKEKIEEFKKIYLK